MRSKEDELVSILDEMIGAAVSMHQGAQRYDAFVKARDLGIKKIKESLAYRDRLATAIEELHKLI